MLAPLCVDGTISLSAMLTVFFGYDYQTWVWTNTFREIFSVTSGPDLLNLWSYPNLFFRPGKELCDLLVVCGDEI